MMGMTLTDATLEQINKCREAAWKLPITAQEAVRLIGEKRNRTDRDFDPIPFLMQVDDDDIKKQGMR